MSDLKCKVDHFCCTLLQNSQYSTMDSSGESDNDRPVRKARKFRQVSTKDKMTIFFAVRGAMVNGKMKRGILQKLSIQLGFERTTISRQWAGMRKKLAHLLNNQDEDDHMGIIHTSYDILFGIKHSDRRKGKFKHDREELKAAALAIHQDRRPSLRHLSAQMGVPLTTLYYLLKGRKAPTYQNGETIFLRHSSKLKPTLTDENKLTRFLFAISRIKEQGTSLRGPMKFDGQYNRVHIDEKWFWMSKDGRKYILVEGEQPPDRRVRHKKYMDKVMFLCAIARPRWDPHARKMWDGKLGMWPIGYYGKAMRTSVNRPAGTRVWKSTSMDYATFRMMIIDDLIPAIQAKWPSGEWSDPNFKIFIQQDNAGAHPSTDDASIQATIKELEAIGNFTPGKISFEAQPPNSPDSNICDLGLFNAVQSAYYMSAPRNDMEIITMVTQAFDEFPVNKVNRIFVTLMSIYNSIIEHYGDNFFKIPHMNKDKMEREGTLPRELPLSAEAIRIVQNFHNGNQGDDDALLTDSDVEWDEADFRSVFRQARRSDHGDSSDASTMSSYSLNSRDRAVYDRIEAEMKDNGGSDYDSDAMSVAFDRAEAELETGLI
jgi:hypothetical protein